MRPHPHQKRVADHLVVEVHLQEVGVERCRLRAEVEEGRRMEEGVGVRLKVVEEHIPSNSKILSIYLNAHINAETYRIASVSGICLLCYVKLCLLLI
jgi:hypothetical protein